MKTLDKIINLRAQAYRDYCEWEGKLIIGRKQNEELKGSYVTSHDGYYITQVMGFKTSVDDNLDGVILEVQPKPVFPPKKRYT